MLVDDVAEMVGWTPHGVEGLESEAYPAQPARSVSCFTHMCRLSEIIHDIIIHVYDPLQSIPKFGMQRTLEELDVRLEEWWLHLPPTLVSLR